MSPADLHAFWRRTTEILRQTPLRATRTDAAAQSGREYVTSLVHMDSFEGKRLQDWYTVPKDPVPGGRSPAVLVVPGYGGEKPIPTHLAMSGFAVLILYPRGQGESCHEWTLEHSTKLTYHVTDKERFYYRGAYMDCVRGLDFLAS
jgi:cephalosporin-C deacetylase